MLSEERRAKIKYWAKRLECPVDEDAGLPQHICNSGSSYFLCHTLISNQWCNRDLIPIPSDRRLLTWQGYAGYWVIAGINTTAWPAGSGLLSLGLSVPQAMGCVVGVSLITASMAVLAGWPGSHLRLGFPVLSRS